MTGTFDVSSEARECGGQKVYILRLAGTIDASATEGLDAEFTAAIDGGGQHFILDFSRVEYISSAGLRLMLKLRRAALEGGGRVKVAAARRAIRENVLDALGFSRLVDLCVDVDEALESVTPTNG